MRLFSVKRRSLRVILLSILFITTLVHLSVWSFKQHILSKEIGVKDDKTNTFVGFRRYNSAVYYRDALGRLVSSGHRRAKVIRPVKRVIGVNHAALRRAMKGREYTIQSNAVSVGEFFPPGALPPITLSKGFLIENKDLCSQYVSLRYVVVVHTAPSHFRRRESLRNTWARSGTFNGTSSQTIFVIGMTLNETLQREILSENKKHGDIVQGDFLDDYSNLTLKAVMGLKWITKNCANAEYVVKVDDDVFVNIFQVIKTVFPVLKENPKQVYCAVEPRAQIFRNDKVKNSFDKWKVSRGFFKGRRVYPMPFCFGFGTFYTTSFASDLLAMAASTPFYRLDDVYTYGILVSKIEGASWHSAKSRYFHDEESTSELFFKTKNSLVGTVRSAAVMTHMWNSV